MTRPIRRIGLVALTVVAAIVMALAFWPSRTPPATSTSTHEIGRAQPKIVCGFAEPDAACRARLDESVGQLNVIIRSEIGEG